VDGGLGMILDHYKMMLTESGLIGLVPKLTQEGDVLCVLHQYDRPVVLRKKEGHYQFVGKCFVAALMKGEAELVRMLLEEKQITQEVFELR